MSVNFEILRDYRNGEEFLLELANAQSNLKPEDAVEFFNTVMDHFKDTVPEEIGSGILRVIGRIISYKNFLDLFVEKKFQVALPYNQKNLTDDVLDILYILVTRAPNAFNQEVADGFSRMIVRQPRKALLIISIYAQYFEDLENPWPLIDDLINGQRRLSVDECAKEYVLLLAYLVREHPGFRRGRAKDCFSCVAQNLESEDEEVINATYNALATIVTFERNVVVPFREVRAHLRFEQFQDSILDFLLVAPLGFDDIYNAKFISTLLKIATKKEKATLVLMRLAEDVNVAKALVDQPKWMRSDLPTPVDTLRLFLVVFKQLSMRPIIGKKPEFIQFLLNLNDVADEVSHSLICTIIRRVDLTPNLVHDMSKQGFIASFLGNADEIGTDNARYSGILFADTISKVCFTKELVPMCETCATIIQEGGENLAPAIKLATDLCKHARCVDKFQKIRLAPYLERRISKMKNRGHIRALIKLIKGEADEE